MIVANGIATESIQQEHRISRFLRLLSKDNAFCLFHSLTLRKVYGGEILRDVYRAFSKPSSPMEVMNGLSSSYSRKVLSRVITDIIDGGMIAPDSKLDTETYFHFFQHGLNQKQIQHMYFLPTSGCNLQCQYCFVEDPVREIRPEYMTIDIARKGLDVFAKLTEQAERISLTFYGGEPLMNPNVVYFAMRQIRALEKEGAFKHPVEVSLLTNGVLIDDKTIEAVQETRTRVSVPIDGPKWLHDKARIDVARKGTFERAIRGFRRLKESGVSPSISCTLSQDNIENMEEITNFIVNELKPQGVGFNVLMPKMFHHNSDNTYYARAADELIAAFKILRKEGIYEDRVMRRAIPYAKGGFHLKDCMGVGGQIILTPNGRIGPCQAFLGIESFFPLAVEDLHSQMSSINSEEIYRNELFNEWSRRFPLNMKQCVDCPAIAICGGGCPYASFVDHASIWKVDERVCFQAKRILEWMIWDTYEHFSLPRGKSNATSLSPTY